MNKLRSNRLRSFAGQAEGLVRQKAVSALEAGLGRSRSYSRQATRSMERAATRLKPVVNQKTICTCVGVGALAAPSNPALWGQVWHVQPNRCTTQLFLPDKISQCRENVEERRFPYLKGSLSAQINVEKPIVTILRLGQRVVPVLRLVLLISSYPTTLHWRRLRL